MAATQKGLSSVELSYLVRLFNDTFSALRLYSISWNDDL
jgi:hypothetical protein